MAPKIQVDENLVFLYRCLVNSDCKTIDFTKVALATHIKAPAARMRYSRLKKTIKAKLGESNNKGRVVSVGTIASGRSPAAKAKRAIGPSKKRKAAYDIKDEEIDIAVHGDEISNDIFGNDGLKEGIVGRRTRGKRLNFRETFENESGPSSELGSPDQDDASDDEYEMEDDSEDEEEFHAEDAEEYEDDQSVSRRRTTGQSTMQKTGATKFATTAIKKPNEPIPRSVFSNYGSENVSKPGVPVTPRSGYTSRSEIRAKSTTLPPTPESMPSSRTKQEDDESTVSVPEMPTDGREISTATGPKSRRAPPPRSLVEHIENARIRADHKLASISYQANKSHRSLRESPNSSRGEMLPAVAYEHDGKDEGDMALNASIASSTKYSSYTATEVGNGHISEKQDSTPSFGRKRSTPLSSPSEQAAASGAPSSRSYQTAASSTELEIAEPISRIQTKAATPESCIVY